MIQPACAAIFLIETIFTSNEVNMVYSMYDRMVVGGAMPAGEALKLEAIDSLKSDYFTTRREIGIYNVGGAGSVKVGDEVFELDYKEALYIGRGDRDVFSPAMTLPNQRSSTSTQLMHTRPILVGRSRNRML